MRAVQTLTAIAVAAAIVAAGSAARAQDGELRAVDPVKSKVQFTVQHIFVERASSERSRSRTPPLRLQPTSADPRWR